ncbi:hypothetical protein LEN26_002655 [Aphanomyces euteiches]|nr:hypothetical protein LEN26_002655 [Aphanomyces euteiches]
MGKTGRWLILVTQMLSCILVPIVFLVLGGSILTILFPASYGEVTWIIMMGITLLPVCLIPTLKEGAFAAAAGCLGTLLADGIEHSQARCWSQASGVCVWQFGLGVIPALQREHSEPTRMIRVIVVTLGVISVLFLTVAITGVSFVGCQIPGNLLFSIAGSPTALGFTANRGGVILACLCMQLHVIVAFAVIMNPAFFILERLTLGLHKHSDAIPELEGGFQSSTTPIGDKDADGNALKEETNELHDLDAKTYKQPGVYPKVAALRIIVVAACDAIACSWKDHLSDLLDFAGASCISLCNMILPMLFYMKVEWKNINIAEKVWIAIAVVVCLALAVYDTIESGKVLFRSSTTQPNTWDNIKFSYCPAGSSYQCMVYTNVSYHANYTRTTAL